MVPLPIQFLLFMLIGWVSRQQQDVIEYLQVRELSPIVTPDTLLRWYRELVAANGTFDVTLFLGPSENPA